MHFSYLGFIIQPKIISLSYFLPHAPRVAIRNFKVSHHQLEIEDGCANGVLGEEWIHRLHYIKIGDEYHFTCKCLAYINIREKCKDILGPSPNYWISQT